MSTKSQRTFIPGRTQWVMLTLLFVWSLAQPLAVMEAVPIEIRYELFFWKNIVGLLPIAFGFFVILANLTQGIKPLINLRLFLLSLPYPLFSLFNMLFRAHGTSIEEQILYFLWPVALFVIFPAFFPTLGEQSKGLFVICLSNLVALLYAIIPHINKENIADWLDYRYRVHFGLVQPNIYATSWAVIFACSIYFYFTSTVQYKKRLLLILSVLAVLFIFLARSETILLFCFGILLCLYVRGSNLDWRLRTSFICVIFALLLIPLSDIVFDQSNLYRATSGRTHVWARAWEFNMEQGNVADYLFGRASLIAGNPKFGGEREGFQAVRAQGDNVYFSLFYQNGFIGLVLYFLPFIGMIQYAFYWRRFIKDTDSKYFSWFTGVWLGIFLAMWGLSLIPSFGNVINIFLFVASAPGLVYIYNTISR